MSSLLLLFITLTITLQFFVSGVEVEIQVEAGVEGDGGSRSSESCEDDNRPVRPKCPRKWEMFHREPSDENSQTKHWCLRVFPSEHGTTQQYAKANCVKEGSVLSTVADHDEHKFVLKKAKKLLEKFKKNDGSLWIDGVRIQQCVTWNETLRFSSPCNDKTQVFEMEDDHTDPDYTWSQWYKNSPSWSYYPYRVDQYVTYPVNSSVLANCAQMMVTPDHKERHGKIHDMQCDMAVPEFDYHKHLFTNIGHLCGQPAYLG